VQTKLPLCLESSSNLPTVYLTTAISQPLIYRKRIVRIDGKPAPGDWIMVKVEPDRVLGYGIYNPRSEISVRMLRFGNELPDELYWSQTLQQAVRLRHELLALPEQTSAYRLVHAEGDGVSGVVIDRYGDVLSAEVFSLGMYSRATELIERLHRLCGTQHALIQPSPHLLAQEGETFPIIRSEGLPKETIIEEQGTRFHVEFEGGHKTGFFCDQRENRARLAGYCRDRSVLDLCCYTGGFTVQALKKGGAREATGVDLDAAPLAAARKNGALNQVRAHFVQADAFAYMRDMLRADRRFDVVVLDPPKLIRSRKEIDAGTRKHFDLNRLAMQLVAPGGLLLSCTCAGLLNWDSFLQMIHSAARQAGSATEAGEFAKRGPRRFQLLHKTGAGADHPIASNCPETEYLRAVWLRFE
jgi:23S rRNA (cytosine1962-C5)-methyltransferase